MSGETKLTKLFPGINVQFPLGQCMPAQFPLGHYIHQQIGAGAVTGYGSRREVVIGGTPGWRNCAGACPCLSSDPELFENLLRRVIGNARLTSELRPSMKRPGDLVDDIPPVEPEIELRA